MTVTRLNALERGVKLRVVRDRLREHLELAAQRHDLRFLRMRLCGELCERLLLRIREARPGAHAE